MNFQKFKKKSLQKLNNLTFDSEKIARHIIRTITILLPISSLVLLFYLYGFEITPQAQRHILTGFDIIFFVYVFNFLLRVLYATNRTEFLQTNLIEGFVITIIVVNGISNYLLGNVVLEWAYYVFGSGNYAGFYRKVFSLFIAFILVLELARIGSRLTSIKVRPGIAFVLSFVLIIGLGTILLMLPTMTTHPGSLPLVDALFTSVSASCVTGLIVVDTATYFTFRGQLVILGLIQIGGLGIVTFATFFATFLNSKLGMTHKNMIPDYMDTESLSSAISLLKQAVFITFIIETGTAILIFFSWGSHVPFDTTAQKIFFSVFHAISAFCNAGFSLYTNNLYENVIRDGYVLQLVIAFAIIFGAIGFPAIHDIFSPSRMRERLQNPWKDWRLGTKISINVSIFLILFGMVAFYLLEKNNSLGGLNFVESMIASFFQSVASRTAGFNTVDFSRIGPPALILIMFLMFIGGSSASTAGGIKTSTFYLIIVSVIATTRGALHLEVGERYIPNEILFKALSIFFYAIAINLVGVFALSITEPEKDILNLTFEQVSAFGTVGFSTGITGTLSAAGKVVLIISMFLGRVGTLTFAVALSTRLSRGNYKYPRTYLMVG